MSCYVAYAFHPLYQGRFEDMYTKPKDESVRGNDMVTAATSTILSASTAGSTSIQTAVALPASTVIRIDTGTVTQTTQTETFSTFDPLLGWSWNMTNVGTASTRGLSHGLTAKGPQGQGQQSSGGALAIYASSGFTSSLRVYWLSR